MNVMDANYQRVDKYHQRVVAIEYAARCNVTKVDADKRSLKDWGRHGKMRGE